MVVSGADAVSVLTEDRLDNSMQTSILFQSSLLKPEQTHKYFNTNYLCMQWVNIHRSDIYMYFVIVICSSSNSSSTCHAGRSGSIGSA